MDNNNLNILSEYYNYIINAYIDSHLKEHQYTRDTWHGYPVTIDK